jgi:hypothetical protein
MFGPVTRRIFWAFIIGPILISIAAFSLWLADTYASEPTTYCSTSLAWWQWAGCVMAAHEGLAAGLIGAAGALFAAWLAFDAVQEQMRQERAREMRRERPWLFFLGATVRRRSAPDIPNDWFIKLRWKNVGRSPAMIERCEFKLTDKNVIPAEPDYSQSFDLTTPAMAAQDTEFETSEVGPRPQAAGDTPIQYVFFGRLTYRSLEGTLHHTGFAVEVSPNISAFVAHNNKAYDYYD